MKKLRKIALFGGSFNPPHNGHAQVLRWLLDDGDFAEIWLVPVFKHPFGKGLAPFEHRMAMTQLLTSSIQDERLVVSAIESERGPKPSYTLDTIKALKERIPDSEIHIVVGSDVKEELNKWHQIDELKKQAQFLFVPRAGFEDSPFDDISSSKIRQSCNDKTFLKNSLPSEVFKYLLANHLYQAWSPLGFRSMLRHA